MSIVALEAQADPRTCRHRDVEELGRNGAAAFLRCVSCGSIVIAQKRHRWIIRPTDEAGPLPF